MKKKTLNDSNVVFTNHIMKKNYVWTSRSLCSKDIFAHLWKVLAVGATQQTFIVATVRLSTNFMLCTGTHTDLFGNILKQVGGKRCAENTDALALHMINRMRKEPNCFGTLEICWSYSLLRSLSFRAGLSQINNLCNILSVCSFKQPCGKLASNSLLH